MRSKLFFLAIAAFWLVMNYLLWRSLGGAHNELGSAIPVEVVWGKILNAPDPSSLDIYDHDKRIGYCKWISTAGNTMAALNKTIEQDYEPQGLIPQPNGYEIDLDGNTSIFGTNRLRFLVQLRLSTNQIWQDFRFNGKMRPMVYDVHAIAAAQKITVKATGELGDWQKTLKFSDLEHPENLLGALAGGDSMLSFMAGAAVPFPGDSVAATAATVKWVAHEDWMQFGHSRVKVYRVETEILGQHFYMFVSQVGEILWFEAPNKLTFRNEAFNHF